MTSLETIPFSAQELRKKYSISRFEELGVKINVLNEVNQNNRKLPSGNCYKFGVVIDNQLHWYFNGEPVKIVFGERVDRASMREIYKELVKLNAGTKNIPFIFKVKR